MKLTINYDLFDAILDVNEGLTPMKIVRNDKGNIILFNSALFGSLGVLYQSVPRALFVTLVADMSYLAGHYLANSDLKTMKIVNDPYMNKSSNRLNKIVSDLNDNNIYTSSDLLACSKLIGKNYQIRLNDSFIPRLVEHKHILVPTLTTKNAILDQEHEIGSKKYTLSLGSPDKTFKVKFV